MAQPASRPQVLLFDVNETLVDLAPLKERVAALLGDPRAPELWFTTMLQHSLVMTLSGQYAAFTEVGAAALQMLARGRKVALAADDATQVLAGMRSLAAHADVRPGLERLRAAGFRMATLTNSSQHGVQAQMQSAGLSAFFERELSVESVRKFKPATEVYAWAAREMGVPLSACMLVAAHGWDVAGAKWAGLQAAFIARERQQKFPLAPEPDLDVPDLQALAEALSTREAA